MWLYTKGYLEIYDCGHRNFMVEAVTLNREITKEIVMDRNGSNTIFSILFYIVVSFVASIVLRFVFKGIIGTYTWLFLGNNGSKFSKVIGFAVWASIWIILSMGIYDKSAPLKRNSVVSQVVVRVPTANVRSSPSTKSRNTIIERAKKGTIFNFVSFHKKTWVKIKLIGKDTIAYIHNGIVKKKYKKVKSRWPNIWWYFLGCMGIYCLCIIWVNLSSIRREKML
jgi:hypothetical protein